MSICTRIAGLIVSFAALAPLNPHAPAQHVSGPASYIQGTSRSWLPVMGSVFHWDAYLATNIGAPTSIADQVEPAGSEHPACATSSERGHCVLPVPSSTPAINGTYAINSTSSDLGAQITAIITSVNPSLPGSAGHPPSSTPVHIDLAPNSTYFATTPVTNAGIGVFIDCHGSTIDVGKGSSWADSANAFIMWTNLSWTWVGSEFVHPLTGIQNCVFTGANVSHSSWVGYVGSISNFYAHNITVRWQGAFVVDGLSENASFVNINVYNPYVSPAFLQEYSSNYSGRGTTAPGKVLYDHNSCQESNKLPVVCYELDAGDFIIRDTHTEAVGIGIHVNGAGGEIEENLIDMRSVPTGSRGIVLDNVGGHVTIKGNDFGFGDGPSVTSWAIVDNAANGDVSVQTNTFGGESASTSTCELFKGTAPNMYLNFTGNTVKPMSGKCTFNVFDLTKGAYLEQASITSNKVTTLSGAAANFAAPGMAGTITDSNISANMFSRVGNFVFGSGTSVVGNTFGIGASPTWTFTGPGKFAENTFLFGSPTVTLDGSSCSNNTGYECN